MIRREILKLSGGVLGLAAGTPLVASTGRQGPKLALFDARFAPARAFAAAACADGAAVLATGQDLVSLCDEHPFLDASGGVAGMTSYADMVVIAGLAAEQRRALAWRIAHAVEADCVDHRLVDGPPGLAPLLAAAGRHWPQAMWQSIAGATAVQARSAPQAEMRAGSLWSWLLA